MAAPLIEHMPVVGGDDLMTFRRFGLDDVAALSGLFEAHSGDLPRTCDYSVGGIMMWRGYFDYTFCIAHDTLFIKGVTENDVATPAYSLPFGAMDTLDAVRWLLASCGGRLKLSAVPLEQAQRLAGEFASARVEELADWADYLYDASALASLTGKRLSKKRNHVNRFVADNPGYRFARLDGSNLAAVKEFYHRVGLAADKPLLADVEREQVFALLDAWDVYSRVMEGAVLWTPAEGVVAFTVGEVIGDTLYVHIEKMRHDVAGAGEAVNRMFADAMLTAHPSVRYINREEDTGDLGLRRAKESYHPLALLRKANVTIGC